MAKIMLVEDDNNLREIYEARLQAEGYNIVSAKDGEEALVVAKAEKPDLVISDVMMPKISGFEMLDILRNTDGLKEVKVIMLTALGQSDDQQRADKLGADRYLVKSQVTLEDIVKVAHDLLEGTSEPAKAAVEEQAASEPAAPPTPTPAAEPTPVAVAPEKPEDSLKTDSPAQSTAQEEAAVEAKIEDFVAGASSEPTVPAGSGEAEPASSDKAAADKPSEDQAAAEEATPATETTKETATASDDKLMADAVDTLIADTEKAKPSSVSPIAPEAEPIAVTASEAATPPDGPNATVKVAGKKIITPLDDKPKQDLDTLVALEAAKEASAQSPSPAVAVVSSDEAASEAAPASTEPPAKPEITAAPADAATAAPKDPPQPDPSDIAL